MAHVTTPTTVPEPPGPGTWILDTTHFFRPVTRFTQEVFPEPSGRGFSEGTAPYGLLLDRLAWGFADGWPYLSPRPVWAASGTGPAVAERAQWEALVAGSEALQHRLAVSSAVFQRTPWRADLQWWEADVKPALTRRHRQLADVDVARLGDDELLAHLDACRTALQRAIRVHHRLNVAAVLPVGDFLGRGRQWTGLPFVDLLALLVGTSPMAAVAGVELAALVAALGDGGEPRALLADLGRTDAHAGAALATLTAAGGAVGAATVAYLDAIGYWPLGGGFDVGEPSLMEAPDVLVEGVAAALAGVDRGGSPNDALEDRTAEVSSAVPAADRLAFDHALAEARATYRLRDERAVFSDIWANGLTRRGLLELGRRLADTGAVEDPAHLVEGAWQEVRALAGGGAAPSPAELARRARGRLEAAPGDAPPMLGDPPRPPVPVDWLPSGAARTERAFRTYMAAMGADDDDGDEEGEPTAGGLPGAPVRGMAASPGRHDGTARVVLSPSELGRVRKGDVLVVEFTTPAFNVVLPVVGAIVADRGGLLSHTAIVAREQGIPAVVAASEATTRIPDGTRVRVDGTTGEVTVLG